MHQGLTGTWEVSSSPRERSGVVENRNPNVSRRERRAFKPHTSEPTNANEVARSYSANKDRATDDEESERFVVAEKLGQRNQATQRSEGSAEARNRWRAR